MINTLVIWVSNFQRRDTKKGKQYSLRIDKVPSYQKLGIIFENKMSQKVIKNVNNKKRAPRLKFIK